MCIPAGDVVEEGKLAEFINAAVARRAARSVKATDTVKETTRRGHWHCGTGTFISTLNEAFDQDDQWDARFAAAMTLTENTALIQELELARRPDEPARAACCPAS